MSRFFLAALLGGIFLASAARSALADDPTTDEATGRDLRVYPPDRHFDHVHMRLEFSIPDMSKPQAGAVETLTIAALGKPRDVLVLDAADHIKVESLTINGKARPFTREKDSLAVRFDPPAPVGQKMNLVFRYSVDYPLANGTGLTWTAGKAEATNLTDQAAQIHSQGEAQSNHEWFICHDFPNQRLTTELLVTVEDPYTVGANGRLIASRFAGSHDGKTYTTWHWLQDKPHCNYLVCMVVGRFAIVGLPPKDEASTPKGPDGNPLPVYLYAPLGTEKTAQRAYAKTPSMVAFFAEKFDEPYPWDKYSQALVRHFAWGGMENTSITTMQAGSARRSPGSQDEVISHELCHQWTGDLMTCKGWEHLWLNEGWASFAEALWAEADAKTGKKRAYQRVIAGFVGGQRAMNRTYAPEFAPLVSNRYTDPQMTFAKANDVYAKGACVLHMLRRKLGDDAFFKGVRLYMDRCKFTCVETDDFRHALEDASGLNLERFFNQWCGRPGVPRLDVATEWKEASAGGGDLKITVGQTQQIDGNNPAYVLDIPILLKNGDAGNQTVMVTTNSREAAATFHLDALPEDIIVDPDMTIIAPSIVHKPVTMWLRQLEDESVFAQLQAIASIAGEHGARTALVRLALDQEREPIIRRAAAGALAIQFRDALGRLLGDPPPPGEPLRNVFAASGRGGVR